MLEMLVVAVRRLLLGTEPPSAIIGLPLAWLQQCSATNLVCLTLGPCSKLHTVLIEG